MAPSADFAEVEQGKQEKQAVPSSAPHILSIRAVAKALEQVFLPFALLKSDPLIAVQQAIAAEQAPPPQETTAETVLTALHDAWKSLFAELREEQRFFICAWNSVPGTSSQVVRTASLTFAIATPGPLHRRWLTTLPVKRNNELVAWCVEIDMAPVEAEYVTEVVLSERNMLRLASIIPLLDSKVA